MSSTINKRIPTAEERRELLRALSMWTGQADIAEDLVQQTLFEAWRSLRQPEQADEWRPWLFGIARNMLLRWQRDMGKHGLFTQKGPEDERFLEVASTADDLDTLLTTGEMVALLDDLLGRLPTETRDALVLKYVAELPQAEVAHRLGMHEKALEGRLYRGKRALLRALITDRPDTAIELGLVDETGVWQELDLICPSCGTHHLTGRWFEGGGFQVSCQYCEAAEARLDILMFASKSERSRVKRKPSLGRATHDVLTFWSPFHRHGVHTVAHCAICGASITPQLRPVTRADGGGDGDLILAFECLRCRICSHHTVAGSGLLIAEGQSFWNHHRAIHALPSRRVKWHDIDAIESRWQSRDFHRYTAWYSTTSGAMLAIDEDGIETRAADS